MKKTPKVNQSGVSSTGLQGLQLSDKGDHVRSVLNETDAEGDTPLLWAVKNEKIADVIHLLDSLGVSCASKEGDTLFLVEALIKAGANMNHADKTGHTALLLASLKGYFPLVNCLIARGANVHDTNSNGDTAVILAARHGHLELVRLLNENGANMRLYQPQAGEANPPIRLIDFNDFKGLGEFPRFPDNRNVCVNKDSIDRETSLVVFISHCWLRGWSGAEGKPYFMSLFIHTYLLKYICIYVYE